MLVRAFMETVPGFEVLRTLGSQPQSTGTQILEQPPFMLSLTEILWTSYPYLAQKLKHCFLAMNSWIIGSSHHHVTGSSSIGTSLDAPFLAAFSAAAGHRAIASSASDDSDSQVILLVGCSHVYVALLAFGIFCSKDIVVRNLMSGNMILLSQRNFWYLSHSFLETGGRSAPVLDASVCICKFCSGVAGQQNMKLRIHQLGLCSLQLTEQKQPKMEFCHIMGFFVLQRSNHFSSICQSKVLW